MREDYSLSSVMPMKIHSNVPVEPVKPQELILLTGTRGQTANASLLDCLHDTDDTGDCVLALKVWSLKKKPWWSTSSSSSHLSSMFFTLLETKIQYLVTHYYILVHMICFNLNMGQSNRKTAAMLRRAAFTVSLLAHTLKWHAEHKYLNGYTGSNTSSQVYKTTNTFSALHTFCNSKYHIFKRHWPQFLTKIWHLCNFKCQSIGLQNVSTWANWLPVIWTTYMDEALGGRPGPTTA